MFNINYSILNFEIEFENNCMLGGHKTSALRGILGEALARENCFFSLGSRGCKNCYLRRKCLGYSVLNTQTRDNVYFQSDKSISPIIFKCYDCKRDFEVGDKLKFSLIIFADTISYIPHIIDAYNYAGNFLGINEGYFSIGHIKNENGEFIYDANKSNGLIDKTKIIISNLEDYIKFRKQELKKVSGIRVITPLRFKHENKIQKTLNGENLKYLLERRLLSLNALEGNNIKDLNLKKFPLHDFIVRWEEFDRYSNRLSASMMLGGMIGEFILDKLDDLELDALIAGELLHIGKSVSFGLGEYEIF